MDLNLIKANEYVIIQRQKYTKLHKFSGAGSLAILGKDQLDLTNILSNPYFTTFKMVPKESKNKKQFSLEPCSLDSHNLKEVLGLKESGTDNRNIVDDGQSQGLSAEEIENLRESCKTSSEIVTQIVENSNTFNSKTQYSQEKYLKKKEKKYFEFVQIRKPTLRLIAEIYYRQDPEKLLGMRTDTLSQIISYSGVCNSGNYLLYESGTNGIMVATLLNSIGSKSDAKVLYMHPGNVPQKQAVLALNMEKEFNNSCIAVNIYSVLRQHYQGTEDATVSDEAMDYSTRKRKLSTDSSEKDNDKSVKKQHLDDDIQNIGDDNNSIVDIPKSEKKKWQLDNELACELMKSQLDSLLIVAKEHPINIIKTLLPFVKPSRPFVIYNLSREILMECYHELKSLSVVTAIRLYSNFTRMYQILPDRTHPDVNMSGNSGYFLCGYTIR